MKFFNYIFLVLLFIIFVWGETQKPQAVYVTGTDIVMSIVKTTVTFHNQAPSC